MGSELAAVKDQAEVSREDKIDRHNLMRGVLKHLPYQAGSGLFRLLLGNPLAHKVLGKHVALLKKMNAEIGAKPLSREAITKYLLVNYTGYWRLHTLMGAPKKVFDEYVPIQGLEYLQKYAGKRGVVLCNSHYGGGKMAPVAIARLGYDLASVDRIDLFEGCHRIEGMGEIESIVLGKKKEGANFHLKQTFRMKKALENKRILHIAADGYRGGSGKEYAFLGKRRSFPQSFAQLAVATNAMVLPVFSSLQSDGHVQIELMQPFDPSEIEGSKEQRVKGLCEQYISLLESRWKQNPENIWDNDLHIFSGLKYFQPSYSV